MFHKILVCSDGSDCALAAARAGAAIARHHGAEIVALHVFQPAYADIAKIGAWAIAIDQDMIDCCAREERAEMERSVGPIFQDLTTPHRVIQEKGHPAEAILRVAERDKIDLIIVGSRGLRGLTELYLGSTSNSVLHHAPCPVLIVRGEHLPSDRIWFQNILLATDASDCAQAAAVVAVDMARQFAGSLTVLNVCSELSSNMDTEKEEPHDSDLSPGLYAKHLLELVRQRVGLAAKSNGVYCS